MSTTKSPETDDLGFEAAYGALEETVAQLEDGDLSIDAALALYERGVALSARCAALLEQAELRVRQVDEDGQPGADVAL